MNEGWVVDILMDVGPSTQARPTCQRPHYLFLNGRNPVYVTHFLNLMDTYLSRISVLSPVGDKYRKYLKFFPQEAF